MKTTNDPAAKCPICGRALNNPHRRIVDGVIVEGCVDAAHTGHLPPATNTAAWHERAGAKKIRAASRAHLRSIGIRPIPAGHVAVTA